MTKTPTNPAFEVRLARSDAEIRASQRLRYDVFVRELGADGDLVDHDACIEADRYDPLYDHMILLDHARPEPIPVVGVYRLMPSDRAEQLGGFYTEDEYDLTPLKSSGRKLLELGRSCLHRDYRGGAAMYHLWNKLAAYTLETGVDVLFGVASFHGTDPQALAGPLSLLHHRHLAPEDLRARVQPDHYQTMDLMADADINRAAALRDVPALIKAYLRLGGFVGDGAFIDHAFNTTDVCLILDTARMNDTQRAIYTRELTT
ncbi:MAG: GNAT family N-acyltransferase [Pseudomonadota bacterium]